MKPWLARHNDGETYPVLQPEKDHLMFIATIRLFARGGVAGPRFLLPLLLLLLLGGLATWLIRRRRNGTDGSGSGSALDALRERFARGEIDHAEFDHRQAVLVGADVIPPSPTAGAPGDVNPGTPRGSAGDAVPGGTGTEE